MGLADKVVKHKWHEYKLYNLSNCYFLGVQMCFSLSIKSLVNNLLFVSFQFLNRNIKRASKK